LPTSRHGAPFKRSSGDSSPILTPTFVVPKRLLGAPIEHEVVEMRVSVRTGGLRLLIC
jgi:hypothetical protein